MPRGGSRKHPADCKCGNCPKLGRRKNQAEALPEANKKIATQVLALDQPPEHKAKCGHTEKCECRCRCEICAWWELLQWSFDSRLKFDVRKYLTDKRDGKAVQTVNHVHDKPIDLNVNVSIAEIVRKVRQRKQEYERSRS
ncbi:MAG: hypothetical protein JWO19_4410 [Bryobacterales bacterium]|nr:hypothetical protein [Bryobacterales bacterium]